MTILSLWTTLEMVRNKIMAGELHGVVNIAGIIACITAGIAIVKVTRDYIRGTDLDAWEVLRPIALMLLVCNFNTLILGPVNGMMGIVTGMLVNDTDLSTENYVEEWNKNLKKMSAGTTIITELEYQKELQELANDRSWAGRLFGKIWIALKRLFKNFLGVKSMTFAGIIGGILFLLGKILMFVQQLLCTVFLIMSSVLGPLILALSILPGFESNMRNWLARYIQISMWVPVGYFLLAINLWISKYCCDISMIAKIGLGVEWLMICMQIVALAGIAAVPKIAAWVIESSGANDAHGSISNPARLFARKLIKM